MIKTDVTRVIGKQNGKVVEIHRIVGDWYRIDMEGETKESMISGYSNAKRKARNLVK